MNVKFPLERMATDEDMNALVAAIKAGPSDLEKVVTVAEKSKAGFFTFLVTSLSRVALPL